MNMACGKNNVALIDDNDYVAKRQKTPDQTSQNENMEQETSPTCCDEKVVYAQSAKC